MIDHHVGADLDACAGDRDDRLDQRRGAAGTRPSPEISPLKAEGGYGSRGRTDEDEITGRRWPVEGDDAPQSRAARSASN